MKVNIDLNDLQNSEGHYSEDDVKALEKLTGKEWKQIYSEANEATPPDIPQGKPTTWSRDTKLTFIREHGREAFKRLVDERK